MTSPTPQPSLARNFSLMTASLAVTMVLALAFKMVLPRILGPEALGTLYFAESFAGMFMVAVILGMGATIAKTVPHAPAQALSLVRHATRISGLLAIATLAAIAAVLWLLGKSLSTTSLVLIVALYLVLQVFSRDILKKALLALDQTQDVARSDILTKMILVSSGIISLVLFRSIYGLAICLVASELFGFLWLRHCLRRSAPAPAATITKQQLIMTSLPFFLSGAVEDLYRNIDATLLESLVGSKEVGLYGAAVRLMGISLMLVPILTNGIQPVLAHALKLSPQHFREQTHKAMRLLLAGSVPLTCALILSGDWVIALLYGPQFTESLRPLMYLAPAVVVSYLNILLSSCSIITTSGKRMAGYMFIGAGLNGALNYWLIPHGVALWGPGGGGAAAALITLFTELCVTAALIHTLRRFLWEPRILGLALAAGVPIGVLIWNFQSLGTLSPTVRLGILFGATLLVFATRLLTWGELRDFTLKVLKSGRPNP